MDGITVDKRKEIMRDSAKKWWFVFNPYDKKCPAVRHESLKSAMDECKRVCGITGKKTHILECIGTMAPPSGPTWNPRKEIS